VTAAYRLPGRELRSQPCEESSEQDR
jgi:hypothetical protein